MDNRVILTPTIKIDALEINNKILDKLPGKEKMCYSVDTAYDENTTNLNEILPDEFLNSLTPNGLPPHKLNLNLMLL